MSEDLPTLPSISRLHERHYGLTEAVATNYAEAAAVSMGRHHLPPTSVSVVADADGPSDYVVTWLAPTDRQIAAWANRDDATRDGAYGMVIAAAEQHLNYMVVGRAHVGSGCDYLVTRRPPGYARPDEIDFQDVEIYRLEISGIDHCPTEAQLDLRLLVKRRQLRYGRSPLPGLAGVIAFNMARVKFVKL